MQEHRNADLFAPRPTDRAPGAAALTEPVAGHPARGLTLMELLLVMGIISLLAAISSHVYATALNRARVARAIADVRVIERMISSLEVEGALPATLEGVGWTNKDPWGFDYRYMNFALEDPKKLSKGDGKPKNARRDKFLKPLNSTYDLYSIGEDGETKPALGHKTSADDIVRAADGVFVGLGSDF